MYVKVAYDNFDNKRKYDDDDDDDDDPSASLLAV